MILVWFGCIPAFAELFAEGPYLGQTPPGSTAKVFAPGKISLDNRYEYECHFSRDGKQFAFTVTNGDFNSLQIFYTSQDANGVWSTPTVPSFCKGFGNSSPFFSVDGQTMYFSSVRPPGPPYPVDIYKAEWNGITWTDANRIPAPVSTSHRDWRPTLADNGNLYYNTYGGIHRALPIQGVYTESERLPYPINAGGSPWIAPDERYMIFKSKRFEGYGQTDMYVSFRGPEDQWGRPINLGPLINTPAMDDSGFITGDGKYFFFCRREAFTTNQQTDLFWIDARAILPDPNDPSLKARKTVYGSERK